jgi:hypothetical protein
VRGGVLGASTEKTVVVQVDADTRYSDRYVQSMLEARASERGEVLVVADVAPPHELRAHHLSLSACASLDDEIVLDRRLHAFDAVVDDKAAAFTLADYLLWGGHRREHWPDGSELLAETTRLFIGGLLRGARKVDVQEASVHHSPRRLEADAARQLASAGFPYADDRPIHEVVSLRELDRLVAQGDRHLLERILTLRRAHLVALFQLLPAIVARVAGKRPPVSEEVDSLLKRTPVRSLEQVTNRPGLLLVDALVAGVVE